MQKVKKFLHKDSVFITLMLLPAVLIVLVFTYYPLCKGFTMAFQNYNLFNLNATRWVGLDNFRTLFSHDPANTFYATIWNTVKWVTVSLFFQFMIGFLIAMLLRKRFFASSVYKGFIAFPWAVSGFMIGVIWRWILNGSSGVLNDLLLRTGIISEPIGWLSETYLALNSVIIANIWYGIPFFVIMISAALNSVPASLYEAADIDGANGFNKFLRITLPQTKRTLMLSVLLRIIWIFNFPDLIYSMTNGGPGGSSEIITSYMMTKVQSLDFGMASAVGMVVIAILIVFVIIYVWLTSRNDEV